MPNLPQEHIFVILKHNCVSSKSDPNIWAYPNTYQHVPACLPIVSMNLYRAHAHHTYLIICFYAAYLHRRPRAYFGICSCDLDGNAVQRFPSGRRRKYWRHARYCGVRPRLVVGRTRQCRWGLRRVLWHAQRARKILTTRSGQASCFFHGWAAVIGGVSLRYFNRAISTVQCLESKQLTGCRTPLFLFLAKIREVLLFVKLFISLAWLRLEYCTDKYFFYCQHPTWCDALTKTARQ